MLKRLADWPSPAKTKILFIVGLIFAIVFNEVVNMWEFPQVEYPEDLPP
jgi:hypothetical protein